MAVQLGSEIDQLIDERMASGRYASREEVVYQALRMLKDLEETIADIEESLEDRKAGRIRSFEVFDREFSAQHGISTDP